MPSEGLIVTLLVMTISRVAARDKHSISSLSECFEDKLRVDPATAHDPDNADIRGISHSCRASQVSTCVGAPVTQKSNKPWFERSVAHGCPPQME